MYYYFNKHQNPKICFILYKTYNYELNIDHTFPVIILFSIDKLFSCCCTFIWTHLFLFIHFFPKVD